MQELLSRIWAAEEPVVKDKVIHMEKRFGPWSSPQRVAAEFNRVMDHRAYSCVFLVLSLLCATVQV